MRISIRTKLFIQFTGIILLFVVLLFILNAQYLEKYYFEQKKKELLKFTELVNIKYEGDTENLIDIINSIEETDGAYVIIFDEEENMLYNTFDEQLKKNLMTHENIYNLPPKIARITDPNMQNQLVKEYEVIDEDNIFEYQNDIKSNSNFMMLKTNLDYGGKITVRIVLAQIEQSAETANRFLIIVGIILLLVSGIWAFYESKKFTKPIIEITNAAEKMARLDFSKKCEVSSNDEMGLLANSINTLSKSLDSSIKELNQKNVLLKKDIEKERKIERSRREFIANISHELKTPVALIKGYSEGLRENLARTEEDRNFYCEVIADEADRMDTIVRELLELLKIESGKMKHEKTEFNITPLILHIIQKFKLTAIKKGINVNFMTDNDILVMADVKNTRKVLVNYLSNAINYVDEKKEITVFLEDREDKIRINVYNTGKKIPEDMKKKIWNSFYKADKARSRQYGGSGLGLAVVKAVCELDKNKYGFYNKSDGVVFWFELDKMKI